MRAAAATKRRIPLSELAMRWVEVLWSCRCQYHNVATLRCRGCGSRPPRELRDLVAALPVPDMADAEVAAAS
ncbi:MAG: hypothetical protein ACRD2W_13000 [Acidimicrobiales bacterium]